MIDLINYCGWIGNIFFLLGALFLAKKNIVGWYCQVAGNTFYVVFGILLGFKEGMSLICLSIALIIINLYGLKSWKSPKWIKIN